jgi:hypothetical protein
MTSMEGRLYGDNAEKYTFTAQVAMDEAMFTLSGRYAALP